MLYKEQKVELHQNKVMEENKRMDIISIHQGILLESSPFAIFSFKIPGVYQIVCLEHYRI